MASVRKGPVTAPALIALVLLISCGIADGSEEHEHRAGVINSKAQGAAGAMDVDVQRLQDMDRLIWVGDFRAAEASARGTLTELDAAGREDSVVAAQVLERLVQVLLISEKERLPETLQLAQRAVAIKEKELGPRNAQTAASILWLGRLYTQRQEFEVAQAELVRALDGRPALCRMRPIHWPTRTSRTIRETDVSGTGLLSPVRA